MYFATEYKIEEIYTQGGPVAEVRVRRVKTRTRAKLVTRTRITTSNNKLLRKERRQKYGIDRGVFIELLG